MQRPQDVDNDLPPYLKKYNKRNKQLLNLMEGTVAPPPPPPSLIQFGDDYAQSTKFRPAKHHHHHHHKIKTKWIETNLFEEQRPASNRTNVSISTLFDKNSLPGENDQKIDATSNENNYGHKNSKLTPVVHSVPSKIDHFTYHRVASPKLVGAGSYGLLRKQRLPFVAITDKRLGRPSSNRAYVQ